MTEDCWEARMSARAKQRAAAAQAVEWEAVEQQIREWQSQPWLQDRSWLHDWPVMEGSSHVLVGTGVHCIGCGQLVGVTTVVFPEEWKPPGPDPDWPFKGADCPVCVLEQRR